CSLTVSTSHPTPPFLYPSFSFSDLSYLLRLFPFLFFFFFNDPATTEIYTLSLHDALPIYIKLPIYGYGKSNVRDLEKVTFDLFKDRKSTRLNSSHVSISYAVFCLKKKK